MESDQTEPVTREGEPSQWPESAVSTPAEVAGDAAPVGGWRRAGGLGRSIVALQTLALAVMAAGLLADVLSRFSDAETSLSRFAVVATIVALVASTLALVLDLIASRGVLPGRGRALVLDVVSVALLGFSVTMRAVYGEAGLGTPIRAALPLAVALAIKALTVWGERGQGVNPGTAA